MSTDKDVVIFINDGDRHFWSASRAANGLGWRTPGTEIRVFRYDEEASLTLTAAIDAAPSTWDYAKQRTDKKLLENVKQIFEKIARIKRN